jgi:UDPglucose 6-dehydrogenase
VATQWPFVLFTPKNWLLLKMLSHIFISSMPRIAIIGYGVVGRALGAVMAEKVKDAKFMAYDAAVTGRSVGKVRIAETMKEAVQGADFLFVCVPSHLGSKGVEGAGWKRLAQQIAKAAEPSAIVVIKSTLVPGDAAMLQDLTCRRVVVCPEFMSEGTAERDILKPHRVLVGGEDKDAVEAVVGLYRCWVPASRIIRMDAWSAQLAKLLANAMLAQRVSSINSLTALCEKSGGDIRAVAHAVGRDPRIGREFLNASPGFGGSCLEKDLRLLVALAKCLGHPEVARYWQSVIDLNDRHIRRVTRAISKAAGRGGKVAVFGLAFKGGVNDVRNSPSLRIIDGLVAAGHPVAAYDPRVKPLKGLTIESRASAAAQGASVIAILTNDVSFKKMDWRQLASAGTAIYDAHGIIQPEAISSLRLISLGRSSR